MTVLDASAVLALLRDEPGSDAVEDAIDAGAIISSVNLAEVLSKMVDTGASVHAAADLVLGLFTEVEPFGLQAALGSAQIRAAVPRAGLSLADRACLTLAQTRGLPVITADRDWRRVAEPLGADVRTIR